MKKYTQKQIHAALENLIAFGYIKLSEIDKDIIDYRLGVK